MDISKSKFEKQDPLKKLSNTKTIHHQLHAHFSDLHEVTSIVLYFASRELKFDNNCIYTRERITTIHENNIKNIYNFSSMYITAKYIIDQVSYGEYTIKNVDWESFTVELDFIDSELQKSRQYAMREFALNNYNKRKKRIIQKKFESIAIQFFKEYKTYLEKEYKVCIDKNLLNNAIIMTVLPLNFEDEMLLFASNGEDYIGVLSVRVRD